MKRYDELIEHIKKYPGKKICLAFSGGVDSVLVLKACLDAQKEVLPVMFQTVLHPARELDEARKLAEQLGTKLHVVILDEFQHPEIMENTPQRCYFCKKALFSSLCSYAKTHLCDVVLDGTNLDDLSEYRPGLQALKELGIHSPLAEIGFTKPEVRASLADMGLSVASKPSSPCMATRLPYGTTITREAVEMIEKAESFLKELGFTQVRVRKHDEIARVEFVSSELEQAILNREKICAAFHEYGFDYITLDLECFRSGSMDIHIKKE